MNDFYRPVKRVTMSAVPAGNRMECTCVPCPVHDPIAPRGYGIECRPPVLPEQLTNSPTLPLKMGLWSVEEREARLHGGGSNA